MTLLQNQADFFYFSNLYLYQMKYILVYSTLSCIVYPFYTIKTRKLCTPLFVKAYHNLLSWMPSNLYHFLLQRHNEYLLKHLPCENSILEAFRRITQHEGVFGLYKGFSLFCVYTVSRLVITHMCLKYQLTFYKRLLQKPMEYFNQKLQFLQKKGEKQKIITTFCKILIHSQVTTLLFPLLVITYRLRLNEEPVSLGLFQYLKLMLLYNENYFSLYKGFSHHLFATLVHQSLFYFNDLPHSYTFYVSTLMSYFFFSPSTTCLLIQRCTSPVLGFGLMS